MSLVTLDDFKRYIRNELAGADDGFAQSCLDAAEQAVADHAKRVFVKAGNTATTRLYSPSSTDILRIHDCTEVTQVTVAGSILDPSAYQPQPVNGITWSGEAVPYVELARVDGSVWFWTVPGKATVAVTAKWGWPSIPARVTEAIKIAAKDLVDSREVRGGRVAIGEYAAKAIENPNVAKLLKGYLRAAEAVGFA